MAASAPRFEPAYAAALLSAGAAAIHASAAGPHFAEHLIVGALFVVTALAQAAWAALVLTAPSWPLLAAGVVGNLGVVAAWAMSRTVGLPLLPGARVPEPIGALDLAATGFEIALVAACVLLLVAGGPYAAASARAARAFATVGAVAIAAVTSAASAGTPNGGHHHAAPGGAALASNHHPAPPTSRSGAGTRSAAKAAAVRARADRQRPAAAHVHGHDAQTAPHRH